MSLPARLLGANPSIQVSNLLSGTLATPSAKLPSNESAYEFINGSLLEANSASVDFTSIPSTYRALILRINARTTGSQSDTYFRYNGSSTGYTHHLLTGNPPNVNAFDVTSTNAARSGALLPASTQPTGTFGVGYVVINDYASSKLKSGKSYAGFAGPLSGGEIQWFDHLWSDNTAINRIYIYAGDGNFLAGSRFNLYGVK